MAEHKWRAFTGIMFLSFAAMLDFTIVNTALPTIQRELGASVIQLQWVMNIYFLVLAVSMIAAGRLGDLFGHRMIFYIGTTLFAIASIVAGFSISPSMLIISRFFQAIGAAIIFPLMSTLLVHIFPENETAKALALSGTICGLGLAVGPVLGGVITGLISWRFIFFINIPLYVTGMLIALTCVPITETEKDVKIDWLGVVLLVVGVAGVVLGVLNGSEYGWASGRSYGYFIVGGFGLVLFIIRELMAKQPLLDVRLFMKPLFFASTMICAVGGAISGIVLFFNPLFLHTVRNVSMLNTGWLIFSVTLAFIIFSLFINRLVQTIGAFETIFVGLIAGILGAFLHLIMNLSIPVAYIIIPCAFSGIAWAVCNTVSGVGASMSVPKNKVGVAIGTVYTFFNLAGSICLAIAVVIFREIETRGVFNFLSQHNIKLTPLQIHQIRTLLSNPENAKNVIDHLGRIANVVLIGFKQAFVNGYRGAMWFLGIFLSVVLVMTLIARSKYKMPMKDSASGTAPSVNPKTSN